MKKYLKYFVLVFITLFCFQNNVLADVAEKNKFCEDVLNHEISGGWDNPVKYCQYQFGSKENNDYSVYIFGVLAIEETTTKCSFDFSNLMIGKNYNDSKEEGHYIEIENKSKKFKEISTLSDNYNSTGDCPPLMAIYDNKIAIAVYSQDDLAKAELYLQSREKGDKKHIIAKLVNLEQENYSLNVKYEANYPSNVIVGDKSSSETKKFGPNDSFKSVNELNFYANGYSFTGWQVQVDGKWYCGDGYYSDCSSSKRSKIFSPGEITYKNNSNVTLYATWSAQTVLNPSEINQLSTNEEKKTRCKQNNYIWNDEYNFCNANDLFFVKCGDAYDIPKEIPRITSMLINLLKIAVPIILIITSIVTMVKSIGSSEDEMKKAQKTLIRKVIIAIFIFLIIEIVQFVMSKVAEDSEIDNMSSCMSCFVNNDCANSVYYRIAEGSQNKCYTTDGKEMNNCPEEDDINNLGH